MINHPIVLEQKYTAWEFDVFQLAHDNDLISRLILSFFSTLSLDSKFHIEAPTVINFIDSVRWDIECQVINHLASSVGTS